MLERKKNSSFVDASFEDRCTTFRNQKPSPNIHRRLVLRLLRTAEQTGTSGGNETSLLTLGGVSRDGRGLTDMLVVTTTVGMVHGVHGNTTSLGP